MMPAINTASLTDLTAEETAILAIIIKKDGTLRASKPNIGKQTKMKDATSPYGYRYAWATEEQRLTAHAAYVWRNVAFAVSRHPAHQCMPVMAFCDLDGPSDERKATEKRLDAFVNRIVKCVPFPQQAGTIRWGRALGMIA